MKCREVIPKSNKTKPFHTTFLFKRKRNEQGGIKRHKAHLVFSGNEKTDFSEDNFSPVPDLTVQKLIMCLALQVGWYAKYLFSENGFLNGQLDRPGFSGISKYYYNETEQSKYDSRRNKSLYGLKEAVPIWNQTLFTHFRAVGLTEMEAAPCIFPRKGLAMICYVDDLIVIGKTNELLEHFKTELSKRFEAKGLGSPKQFLGIELYWSSPITVHTKQTNLVNKLLNNTVMLALKPVISPVDPPLTQEKARKSELLSKEKYTRYQGITDSLL